MVRAEIKRKFDEIVAFAEVERFLDTPVKRYSSGMYVRLAFAVAAHLDPEILLIDEVLAVGDAEFQKKCLAKMEDVASNEGRTVIFVSHNMDAVRRLCSTCIMLRQGEIAKSGDTSDVIAAYLGGEQGSQHAPVANFAPKQGDATIRFAGLYGPEGQALASFSTSEAVLLKCFFNVQRRIPGLRLSFDVFNFKGDLVFYSTISMAEPAISIEASGEYKIAALIPGRLLLPGSYSITLALHTPKTKLYDRRRQALTFRIVGTMADKFDGFSGDDLGQVYANVKWQRVDEPDIESPVGNSVSILASS
jgi:lipopolysaccharide transport system ATP-binding protein